MGGDGRTVNIRNSGSLSCHLDGASGRLVLRWWALLCRRFFSVVIRVCTAASLSYQDSSPCRKMGREPGRFCHMPGDVLCVVLIIELHSLTQNIAQHCNHLVEPNDLRLCKNLCRSCTYCSLQPSSKQQIRNSQQRPQLQQQCNRT